MGNIEKLRNFGIINIDKSVGPTSFTVSNFIKRELKLNKTSHLGTLDPKVSGVLPITLGRTCRLAGFFMRHDKTYIGILHTHKEQNIKFLQKLIDENFVGKIEQIPPHKSAVKRAIRVREVYFWNLLEADELGKNFLFECSVEGGTYIRKLCSDLGEMIGGGHMEELRRTKAGIFDEEKMYSLFEFQDAVKEYENGNIEKLSEMIIPAEMAIKKVMKFVEIKKSSLKRLLTGKPLLWEDLKDKKDWEKICVKENFAVFCGDQFVELAEKVDLDERRIAKALFVYN